MTSIVFSDLFEVTSPVSIFLQSRSLDYLSAWKTISTLSQQLDSRNDRHYIDLYNRAKEFARAINSQLDSENIQIEIEEDFSERRVSKRKKMAGETASDERGIGKSPSEIYRVEQYLEVSNNAKNSIRDRFQPHASLLSDCGCLDPKRFDEIIDNGIPEEAFEDLALKVKLDKQAIKRELLQFASQYKCFHTSLQDAYTGSEQKEQQEMIIESDSENDDNHDTQAHDTQEHNLKLCKACIACAFKTLHQYALQTSVYENLYICYKYVLTLPCTQVTCERVFSKLKIVKTKLRSSLGQDLLEYFVIMNVEYDILNKLDKEDIVNVVAKSSPELERLLLA